MHIVSIIAEYNPFHFGHLYQIEEIRKHFGTETAVVAIMSGNYVQRGECASFDKFLFDNFSSLSRSSSCFSVKIFLFSSEFMHFNNHTS